MTGQIIGLKLGRQWPSVTSQTPADNRQGGRRLFSVCRLASFSRSPHMTPHESGHLRPHAPRTQNSSSPLAGWPDRHQANPPTSSQTTNSPFVINFCKRRSARAHKQKYSHTHTHTRTTITNNNRQAERHGRRLFGSRWVKRTGESGRNERRSLLRQIALNICPRAAYLLLSSSPSAVSAGATRDSQSDGAPALAPRDKNERSYLGEANARRPEAPSHLRFGPSNFPSLLMSYQQAAFRWHIAGQRRRRARPQQMGASLGLPTGVSVCNANG